jgi:hypothetical protein
MEVIVGQNWSMNFSNFTELWAFEIKKCYLSAFMNKFVICAIRFKVCVAAFSLRWQPEVVLLSVETIHSGWKQDWHKIWAVSFRGFTLGVTGLMGLMCSFRRFGGKIIGIWFRWTASTSTKFRHPGGRSSVFLRNLGQKQYTRRRKTSAGRQLNND